MGQAGEGSRVEVEVKTLASLLIETQAIFAVMARQ
jgi:hypothetical protein